MDYIKEIDRIGVLIARESNPYKTAGLAKQLMQVMRNLLVMHHNQIIELQRLNKEHNKAIFDEIVKGAIDEVMGAKKDA